MFVDESIMLAGYLRDIEEDAGWGIPYLRDSPWIGWIFGGKSTRKETVQRMFVITPHIVDIDRETLARFQATRLRDVVEAEEMQDDAEMSDDERKKRDLERSDNRERRKEMQEDHLSRRKAEIEHGREMRQIERERKRQQLMEEIRKWKAEEETERAKAEEQKSEGQDAEQGQEAENK